MIDMELICKRIFGAKKLVF